MRKKMFYKFKTLRVQNFQKLIVSDLSEMKKTQLSSISWANLVPSLQAQESGCPLRMFAKDLMGRNFPPHWAGSRGILCKLLLLPLWAHGLGIQLASTSSVGFKNTWWTGDLAKLVLKIIHIFLLEINLETEFRLYKESWGWFWRWYSANLFCPCNQDYMRHWDGLVLLSLQKCLQEWSRLFYSYCIINQPVS